MSKPVEPYRTRKAQLPFRHCSRDRPQLRKPHRATSEPARSQSRTLRRSGAAFPTGEMPTASLCRTASIHRHRLRESLPFSISRCSKGQKSPASEPRSSITAGEWLCRLRFAGAKSSAAPWPKNLLSTRLGLSKPYTIRTPVVAQNGVKCRNLPQLEAIHQLKGSSRFVCRAQDYSPGAGWNAPTSAFLNAASA